MDPVEEYARRIAPVREQYHRDFATLEASWVGRRQAVVDRVEREVGIYLEGLIDFLSRPVDRAHERAVARLFETYTAAADAIRQELGL